MDFSSPPEVQELVARVREFVRREVLPLERRVGSGFKALEPALRELRASARRQGLWAPQLSRELGWR